MEWPHFFNKSALLNELHIYAAFFSESNGLDFSFPTNRKYASGQQITSRTWMYGLFENSFLSGKPVFVYSPTEAILYDYSALNDIELNNQNIKDFQNNYGVKVHDLTKENLSITTIKEILANNAKAAIKAEKLVKEIDALNSINEDFD